MSTEEFIIELLRWYGPYILPMFVVVIGGGYFVARNWGFLVDLYRESKKKHPDIPSSFDTLKATLSYRKAITHHTDIHLDSCRRQMLDDLMQIRYDAFLEALTTINSSNFYNVQPVVLHGLLLSVINDAVNNAERKSKEAGIPEIAIHLFCVPTYLYIQYFMTVVKAVCGDLGFKSNNERLRLLYSVLTEFVDEGSREAEEAFASAHEQFSGVVYKGYVCE